MSRYESVSTPLIVRFPEMRMLAAASTWLMPSVAMNELTFNFTTMKPDTKPTAPHASNASAAFNNCGESVFWANVVVIAMEKPIINPIDRSNVSATSGTRNARASMATIAFSVSTSLMLVAVRNSGCVRPKISMNAAHR